MIEALSTLLLWLGGAFFVVGTVGLLRFPDVYSRLHALTKADTLGLGLVILGLSLRADRLATVLLMLFIWLLVMASSATACQLLARYQLQSDKDSSDGSE
ncbi:multisubunit Na+/H+ antiporter subunit MnhG [Methylophaga lonarensis MPL]|uniref:Multisubunit Na+/H+ antiporter subunit MnhG n=1 Tax=Methylophaga lonarensis MPL TaxID=1286106 RepID=M7PTQ5_9GAMM|nr:monovalent cation/H(+) antiporter subunit G [Methylophaga lonarensis]EMR13829.1 multisubunit Na+/H+ antiporter subunit MnhG [Methylophaga lonarensis MPL]